MRFSILFLFLVAIVGLGVWQNLPEPDPIEEAGKKAIAQMKREAALREAREAMDIEERKKDAAKLQRQHPKLLDECLKMGGYRRSHLHIHEFNDASKIAFCTYGTPINLKDFSGQVFYQHRRGELPQVIPMGGGATESFVGFDLKTFEVSFKFDGFYADEKVLFRDARIPAIRNTYNCTSVTKECALERRKKCVFSKDKAGDYKADYNYVARIDESYKDFYEAYFLALDGGKESRRTILQFSLPKNEADRDDQHLLLDAMKTSLKRYRRAGCL